MKNLQMFCLTLDDRHLDKIKSLNYSPVGLGDKLFNDEWFTDKSGNTINKKNPFYGEYTFHYWIWKNYLNKIQTDWVGFCQYRKFWLKEKNKIDIKKMRDLNNIVIKEIPPDIEKYESIIGEPFFVNQFRLTKFIKRNLFTMLKNPSLFFDKRKRNLKFHFDMWHGNGNLDKAINLLESSDKEDFKLFMNNNVSFNPHNMFVCKKKVLVKYYESIFPWLLRCEKEFGFKDLKGFGLKRIYGFLAERYLSYWFKKNTKYKILPILFKDITNLN